MKKCTFVIPYFGSFPNYFPLFLKSCDYNRDYEWLIITNNTDEYNYPNNVRTLYMTFEQFKGRLEQRLGIQVNIQDYHKICDFKPTYGYVFEEELKNSLFWGYCDMDLVFGNLNALITKDMLENYDKLFALGHLVMFKNSHENNRLFMAPLNGEVVYKKVLTSPKTFIFDEPFGIGEGKCIHDIFIANNKRVFSEDFSLNLKIEPANIIQVKFDYYKKNWLTISHRNDICLWKDGRVEVITCSKGHLSETDYLYMHFQSRKMKFDNSLLDTNHIKILGDGFYQLEYSEVTLENFKKIKKTIVSTRCIKIMIEYKVDAILKKLGFRK